MSMISLTGGLSYHLRALTHSNRGWKRYREAVGRFLASWKPNETRLLLVGPSGGYALNSKFLARFDELIAIDPDPVAKLIFKRRFRENFRSRKNSLKWIKQKVEFDSLDSLLATLPGTAVLFCNVLGQIPLVTPETKQKELEHFFKQLPLSLKGRSYASFHDRLSGQIEFSKELTRETRWLSNSEIIDRFCKKSGRPIELTDHETEGLFPGAPRSYMEWELTPGTMHLIEGVHS